MYRPEDTLTFRAKMKKLRKKDWPRFESVRRKMDEILADPHHYKPMGNVMAGERRVHIDPFVFTFDIDDTRQVVRFIDFDHHDKIYRN